MSIYKSTGVQFMYLSCPLFHLGVRAPGVTSVAANCVLI